MSSAEWGTLIPAVIALIGAAASWFRAQAAHKRIDNLPQNKQP